MIQTDGPDRAVHLSDQDLAAFLDGSLAGHERRFAERHLAGCAACMEKAVSAFESVKEFRERGRFGHGGGKRKGRIMNKINLYLILALISFTLSFVIPRYFLQLLVGTLLLGAKWVADSKSTRMLVMIYEAWKSGGKEEASRIIETLEARSGKRL
jgi:hypothetical protein